MIINKIYETQNILSLQLVSFLVRLRTYQHPCRNWTRTVKNCTMKLKSTDFKFEQLWKHIIWSTDIRYLILSQVIAKPSEEPAAYIFRVRMSDKLWSYERLERTVGYFFQNVTVRKCPPKVRFIKVISVCVKTALIGKFCSPPLTHDLCSFRLLLSLLQHIRERIYCNLLTW